MDFLSFIFIERVSQKDTLDKKSRRNITQTFLNKSIQKKQAELAKLVDIYFLKRLKRFKEVELK